MDFEKKSVAYRIFGVVQGVGFRPFVARLAKRYRICGYVKNCGGYVELLAQGDSLRAFLHDLFAFYGIISYHEIQEDGRTYDKFEIIESTEGKALPPLMTPDLPLCDECEKELFDKKSRRYRHPFISCARCGARYSIIQSLPYDRERTTMDDFGLCDECEREYKDIEDRRHYAQTQCCNDCGPTLYFNDLSGESALSAAICAIKDGKVVAIKGVGGYHLAASPFSDEAVSRLRAIKKREEKPLAIMMRDMETAEKYCVISNKERELLLSLPRPIVLIDPKRSDISPLVAGESDRLGIFLPYTGYQHLILEELEAVVLTSANVSDLPMIIDDDEAKGLPCDGVLWHNRKIVTPLDDSVVAACGDDGVIYRRGRGYTPLAMQAQVEGCTFAAGGDLKAAFGFSKDGNLYISQYLGDLENTENQERYKAETARVMTLLGVEPSRAVCDLHPGYFSKTLCEKMGLPTVGVQHHFAHTLSVMAENRLGSTIGISFDGTGYGTDGAIWGGEFLHAKRGGFVRLGHLQEFEMLGGNDFAKDAKKCAMSALISAGFEENLLRDERFATVSAAHKNKINLVKTTSAGRLFDAVSAMLGICNENTFEGKCGEALCRAAAAANEDRPIFMPLCGAGDKFVVSTANLWQELLHGGDKEVLARGFHLGLAQAIVDGAIRAREMCGENTVCLSGGVFQNRLLLPLVIEGLRKEKFSVYFNRRYPLGDGNIAVGQLYFKEDA